MISSVAWIPRGASRTKPVRFELSAEEIHRIEGKAKDETEGMIDEEPNDINSDDDQEDSEDEEPVKKEIDPELLASLPAGLRMDEYSDDEEMGGLVENHDLDDMEMELMGLESGGALVLDDEFDGIEGDSEDEDRDDDLILTTDSPLLLAHTEDEHSHLEVQVLTADGSLYTHHDILLPDFPLSLAWMDIPPFATAEGQTQVGSYVAVGTFSPAIEIWNLDVLDPVEPSAVLGGEIEVTGSKKKGKKGPVFRPGSHTEAVMSLSWNSVYRPALASGSADKTVKVWDITTQTCQSTYTCHGDKVQSVLWHYGEAWLLASGGFDKSIQLTDCRSGASTLGMKVTSDIECLAWDPFNPFHLYSSLEDGRVVCVDIRNATKPGNVGNSFFEWQAHDKTTSNLHFSAGVKGMLATCSIDKTVRMWDVSSFQSSEPTSTKFVAPRCVAYKSMSVGKLFTLRFSPDDPFMLATAGDKGMVAVWETDELEVLKNHFGNRVVPIKNPYLSMREKRDLEGATIEDENNAYNKAVGVSIPVPDDSWMDDNEGIDTGRNNNKTKKGKGKGKK